MVLKWVSKVLCVLRKRIEYCECRVLGIGYWVLGTGYWVLGTGRGGIGIGIMRTNTKTKTVRT